MSSFSKRNFTMLCLAGLISSTLCGCAPSQATHHSGQIGRFYSKGIAFSVPLAQRADKPGVEDKFWELRRGIGNSLVAVLSPIETGSDKFRENMVLTVQDLEKDMTGEEFSREQLGFMRKDGSDVQDLQTGTDEKASWATYSTVKDGESIACKVWFFTKPHDEKNKAIGATLLGSAQKGPKEAEYMQSFADIAATFKFARPESGFELLSAQLNNIALVAKDSQAPLFGSQVNTKEASPKDTATIKATSKEETLSTASKEAEKK